MAKCAYHSNREAVGACVNCGKLVCEECKTALRGKTYCNPCANDIYLGKTAAEAPEVKATATQVVSTEIPRAAKGFLTHADESVGYSISCPEPWKRMSESADILVGFEAPEAEFGITASCVLAHEEVPVQESLQSYFARSKGNLQKRLKEYNLISEEELTIDQMPAIKHVYSFSNKNVTFKQMQIYLKQGKVGWVTTCSSAPDVFGSYQPTFETVAASFHLLGSSRGDTATFIPSKGAMKGDIRGWGIALIIMGIIQIFVPLLDTTWGGVLIAIGVLELFVQHRALFIVNGIVIIIAGIMNLVVAIDEGSRLFIFSVFQFIWGVNEIRKFFKYRSAAAITTVER